MNPIYNPIRLRHGVTVSDSERTTKLLAQLEAAKAKVPRDSIPKPATRDFQQQRKFR